MYMRRFAVVQVTRKPLPGRVPAEADGEFAEFGNHQRLR